MVKRWSNLIAGMDAFIFVTPEYNRGYSDTLETAIDELLWMGKVMKQGRSAVPRS